MFSYCGSKSKIVMYYPHPKYKKIIEPFAGSARYALKHWKHDVLLVDKCELIIKLWHYLQSASESDILKLPKFKAGMELDKMGLSEGERLLLGFYAGPGSVRPRNKVSPIAEQSFNTSPNRYKNIARNLKRIKHWEIRLGDYKEIENEDATWFIDPPYQFGGELYIENNKKINYVELAEWCKSRKGQILVCENHKADWMPFKPMKVLQGIGNTFTTEMLWSNLRTDYDITQDTLF